MRPIKTATPITAASRNEKNAEAAVPTGASVATTEGRVETGAINQTVHAQREPKAVHHHAETGGVRDQAEIVTAEDLLVPALQCSRSLN